MYTLMVTGSRRGPTELQIKRFRLHLEYYLGIYRSQGLRLVHGNCDGVDLAAAEMASELGLYISAYPSNLPGAGSRFFPFNDVMHAPAPPLERNITMVQEAANVCAMPAQFHEIQRSGTWHAVRQARKFKKGVSIIDPDGHMLSEEGTAKYHASYHCRT